MGVAKDSLSIGEARRAALAAQQFLGAGAAPRDSVRVMAGTTAAVVESAAAVEIIAMETTAWSIGASRSTGAGACRPRTGQTARSGCAVSGTVRGVAVARPARRAHCSAMPAATAQTSSASPPPEAAIPSPRGMGLKG